MSNKTNDVHPHEHLKDQMAPLPDADMRKRPGYDARQKNPPMDRLQIVHVIEPESRETISQKIDRWLRAIGVR